MTTSFQKAWGEALASTLDAIAKTCSYCAHQGGRCQYPHCWRKILEDRYAAATWGQRQLDRDGHSAP